MGDSSVTIKLAVKGEADVVQSIKRVERSFKDTQKAVLAVASGFGIVTLINRFTGSMSEAVNSANRFGLISQQNTIILAKYATATKELEQAKAKLGVEIMSVLAPALTSAANVTSNLVSGFGNMVGTSNAARTGVLGVAAALTTFSAAFTASKIAGFLGMGGTSSVLGRAGLFGAAGVGGFFGGKAIGEAKTGEGFSISNALAAAMLNIRARIELMGMPTAASRDRVTMLEKEMADLLYPKKSDETPGVGGLVSKEDLDQKMRMIQLQVEENNQLAERNQIGLEGHQLDLAQLAQLTAIAPLLKQQGDLIGTAYAQKLITNNEKREYELQLAGQLLGVDKERAKFTLTVSQTYKAQTDEIDRRLKVIQSTFGISQIQKDAESLKIVQDALLQNAKALADLQANAPSAEITANQDGTLQYSKAYADYLAEINRLLKEKAELEGKSKELDRGNFGVQFGKAWDSITNDIGTTAEIIARAFKNIANSSITSVAAGIKGLVNGTMRWGEALKTIEVGIVEGIIDAFAKMAAQWIVTHLIMEEVAWAWAQVRMAIGWATAGEEAAAEATKTPGLAVNATLSSISSWGVGAWIGVAALVAALGVGIAAAAGAFESGGYTGAGASNMPAGIVHKNEFVMPSHVVDSVGLPALEAIKANQSIPSGTVGGMRPMTVCVFDDRTKMADFLRGKDAEDIIVTHVGKRGFRGGRA